MTDREVSTTAGDLPGAVIQAAAPAYGTGTDIGILEALALAAAGAIARERGFPGVERLVSLIHAASDTIAPSRRMEGSEK